jgi:hypothetical protein
LVKGGLGIDGCTFRILTVINGFIRSCLAFVVARRLNCDDVLECWTELFARHAPPDHIRADNGTDNGPSSPPRRSGLGLAGSASRPSTSSRAVSGRNVTARV